MSLFGQKKNTANQEIEKKRKENENVSDWSRETTNQKSLSFEGHPLRSDTSITGARGFIFLLLQTAELPESDAGSGVIKPALSFVIQNCQTSCFMWCLMNRARC